MKTSFGLHHIIVTFFIIIAITTTITIIIGIFVIINMSSPGDSVRQEPRGGAFCVHVQPHEEVSARIVIKKINVVIMFIIIAVIMSNPVRK